MGITFWGGLDLAVGLQITITEMFFGGEGVCNMKYTLLAFLNEHASFCDYYPTCMHKG